MCVRYYICTYFSPVIHIFGILTYDISWISKVWHKDIAPCQAILTLRQRKNCRDKYKSSPLPIAIFVCPGLLHICSLVSQSVTKSQNQPLDKTDNCRSLMPVTEAIPMWQRQLQWQIQRHSLPQETAIPSWFMNYPFSWFVLDSQELLVFDISDNWQQKIMKTTVAW